MDSIPWSLAIVSVYVMCMSISFRGVRAKGSKYPETLDLNNGLASRILTAMGYPFTGESSGEMPVGQAQKGLATARQILPDEDLEYLDMLDDIVRDLAKARKKKLCWY